MTAIGSMTVIDSIGSMTAIGSMISIASIAYWSSIISMTSEFSISFILPQKTSAAEPYALPPMLYITALRAL